MSKDYYKILGIEKSASSDEIKRAFRKLSHQHHPDKGGDAEKFKEINEAYQILSDSQKKAQYDQFGSASFNGGTPGGGGGFDFNGFRSGGFNTGGFEFNFGGTNLNDIFDDFLALKCRRFKLKYKYLSLKQLSAIKWSLGLAMKKSLSKFHLELKTANSLSSVEKARLIAAAVVIF